MGVHWNLFNSCSFLVFDRICIKIGAWDPSGPLGTPWDPLGPLGTPWDPLGPVGTPWDPLGPTGIHWNLFNSRSFLFFDRICIRISAWDPLGPLGTRVPGTHFSKNDQ